MVGENGADFLRSSNGADVVFGGTQTTADANGLYAESQEGALETGVNDFFFNLMTNNFNRATSGATSIVTNANIFEGKDGNDTLVATTGKDVFFYQTNNTDGNSTLDLDDIQNFTIGEDSILVVNYNDSGDSFFVAASALTTMQTAVDTLVGDTTTENLYAADSVGGNSNSKAWKWTLDANKTDAGTLSYMNTAQDAGIGTPANANFSIHFTGIQGTIVDVNSFFPSA